MSNAEFSCKTATITITKEQEKKNIFIATESIKFPIYCKHPWKFKNKHIYFVLFKRQWVAEVGEWMTIEIEFFLVAE